MKQGFSLVELSVVLVIIGLLVGGVLFGQNLIRAAKLIEMTTRIEHYRGATKSFQDQYRGLPGDLPFATDFWPVDPAGCPNGGGTSGVCSGGGNDRIDRVSNSGSASSFCESLEFWRHLVAAGLIEGNYVKTGKTAANCFGPDGTIPGTNTPKTKVDKNAGYGVYWYGTITSNAAYPGNKFFLGNYGNTMIIGRPSMNGTYAGQFLSPEEAWNIDKKLDDGSPDSGSILSPRGPGNAYTGQDNCATSGTTGSADYDLTNEDRECYLVLPNFVQ